MPALPASCPRRFVIAILFPALTASAGPALAISSRTLFTPTGAAAGDQFGFSAAAAGDINGDGFADLIVGAIRNDASGADAGRAYVYFGGPAADATADLVLTGATAGDEFGNSVAGAGDVNGDGFADLIVGAELNDAGGADAGRAYVYYGGLAADATADLTLTGAAGELLGVSVAGAGDVNGDGFADLIVGARGNDAGGIDAGRAYVYYGGPAADATADLTLTGEAAGDQFGYSVAGAGDINGDGFADLVVGAWLNSGGGAFAGRAYVYYGGPAADAIADLTLTGAMAGDQFGYSVAGAGDVSGDGFADVVVGGLKNDAGGADAGRAYVYHGGPGADATADLILTGAAAGDLFGSSVAGAGDVNGDGFADLIVGAFENDANGLNAGRAYVYHGGPAADATADLTLTGAAAGDRFGISVARAGDVDGDGFGDLIVGADRNDAGGPNAGRAYVTAVYPYQVLSPNGAEQWVAGEPATVRWRGHDVADLALSFDGGFSYSIVAVGVGGEEQNAFTITAPATPTEFAKVRLSYSGQGVSRATSDASDGVFRIVPPAVPPAAAHRLRLTPTGAAGGDAFGFSVAGAGDVNGDGFADLIVGAWLNDTAGLDAGRAYVYYGGPGADATADLMLTGVVAGDRFGSSVAGAGDINGDGFADLIVGANFNDAGGANAGRAYVYYGGLSADAIADLTLTGAAAGDQFGISVAGAGDVNGDGFDDLIVGALFNDAGGADAGRAYVYRGGPAADAIADLTLTGAAAGDRFGSSVAGAGDLNGDSFADLIVGANFNDAAGAEAGRAYVYHGGASADATADRTLTGAAAGDQFGISVAGAGDVNGDGFADLIVGAWSSDAGGVDAGRAYVYYSGPGADAIADLTLTGAAAADQFGTSVAGAGDVNGDGFADLIVGAQRNDMGGADAGRAYVYYGGPGADATADLTLTGAAPGDEFGVSVANAGDVAGDGFADLIVGAWFNDASAVDAGAAFLFDCNRYFVLSPNDDEVWNVGAAQTVTWLGAERADLWLSADGGNRYQLLRHDVGGSESNTLALLVPHVPTKFARVKVTPADPSVRGADESDSLFTIQSSVALLSLAASLTDRGAELSWSTDPGVGPAGLAGYRLYRLAPGASGNGVRIGPELIAESRYTDPEGAPGSTYRLVAVNGLAQELELGRVMLAAPIAELRLWPSPLGRNQALTIAFAAPLAAPGHPATHVDVGVFDVGGRRVATVARGVVAPRDGVVSMRWQPGETRPGLYFIRVEAPSERLRQIRKLVVLP